MKIKIAAYLRGIIFTFFFMLGTAWANTSTEKTSTLMTVADIHLTPFYNCDVQSNTCPIIEKLKESRVSQWKEILEQDNADNNCKSPRYNKNTSYSLFHSSLEALKKQAHDHHVQFVLLLGDLLAHDYKKNYQKYTGDTSSTGIKSFVNKTMQFIISELNEALPDTDIYTVVGNNDTYSDHYISEPEFYKKIDKIWGESIKNRKTRAKMEQDFSQGGYYGVDIPNQKKLRLIVLNTTFFSTNGIGMEAEARKELDWLDHELAAVRRHHQKTIIALHIPVGIDAYDSIEQNKVMGLWSPTDTQRFLSQLNCYAHEVMAIFSGHLHADSFEIITTNAGTKKIPVLGTPAISPLFGNNPGFKIFSYFPNHLEIQNYFTYYYPLDNAHPEWKLAYNFNKIYQSGCCASTFINNMDQVRPTGEWAEHYKKFYMLGRDSQPITTKNKWMPYYYCAIRNIMTKDYEHCISSPEK